MVEPCLLLGLGFMMSCGALALPYQALPLWYGVDLVGMLNHGLYAVMLLHSRGWSLLYVHVEVHGAVGYTG